MVVVFFDGVVKTSIYCVVCPETIHNIFFKVVNRLTTIKLFLFGELR